MNAPPHRHELAPTSHTVEMAQVAELNARLAEHPRLTAEQLRLTGAPLRSGSRGSLPGSAELRGLTWDGIPEFPTLHAVFAPGTASDSRLVVELHTESLHELGRRLGLRQAWGVGPAGPASLRAPD